MSKIEPFEQYSERYEQWFREHRYVFQAEIEAVHKHLPDKGFGLEIGVGSDLFAEPLGIHYGLEPSAKMRALAVKRGVTVVEGAAERLPFLNNFYDFVLLITTICFVDDAKKSISEGVRIVKPGGKLIIGLIDRERPLGIIYQQEKQQNVFYCHATFYSVDEVGGYMKQSGLKGFRYTQTLFKTLAKVNEVDQVLEGYGSGSFVVVSAYKSNDAPD